MGRLSECGGDKELTTCIIQRRFSHEPQTGSQRGQMKTQIRQPGSSYSIDLLEKARREFRSGNGSALEFAERHDVKRTTALGWKKKAEARMPLRCKGAPRRFGPFEETQCLKELIGRKEFQNHRSILKYAEFLDSPIEKKTAQRWLLRWGISMDGRQCQCHSESGRRLMLWREEWRQPEDTVVTGKEYLQGVLWLLASRRGLEGFMLTDDSDMALASVVAALECTIKPRHHLWTNCPNLAAAAVKKKFPWKVTVADE